METTWKGDKLTYSKVHQLQAGETFTLAQPFDGANQSDVFIATDQINERRQFADMVLTQRLCVMLRSGSGYSFKPERKVILVDCHIVAKY